MTTEATTPFVVNATDVSTAMTSADNTTVTAAAGGDSESSSSTVVIAVVVSAILLATILAAICLLQKFGVLPKFYYNKSLQRKRRSSTSSIRRALGEEETVESGESEHRPNEKLKKTTAEMFTIDDFDGDAEDKDKEDYLYDEVYGPSAFEDEATKYSVRELCSQRTSESGNNEEEMLDFDFETLGIKADGFSEKV